jgi:hypothetical protein
MPTQIEISDEVAGKIDELGGTFDTVDDVLRRVLDDAGHPVNDVEWTEEELRDYFDDTGSTRQTVFLETLVEYGDEYAPKDEILERFDDAGKSVSDHTLDGVQSSMTRRCKTAGREKFWERSRIGGQWGYRVKEPYRDIAEDYWA